MKYPDQDGDAEPRGEDGDEDDRNEIHATNVGIFSIKVKVNNKKLTILPPHQFPRLLHQPNPVFNWKTSKVPDICILDEVWSRISL